MERVELSLFVNDVCLKDTIPKPLKLINKFRKVRGYKMHKSIVFLHINNNLSKKN